MQMSWCYKSKSALNRVVSWCRLSPMTAYSQMSRLACEFQTYKHMKRKPRGLATAFNPMHLFDRVQSHTGRFCRARRHCARGSSWSAHQLVRGDRLRTASGNYLSICRTWMSVYRTPRVKPASTRDGHGTTSSIFDGLPCVAPKRYIL